MNAIRKSLAIVVFPTVLAFFVSACGLEPGGDLALAGRGLPNVLSARVIGSETILIEFAEPADNIVADASVYDVRNADDEPLMVNNVALTDNHTKARLTTSGQLQEADYTIATIAGVQVGLPIARAKPPRVVGAVSVSNTEVLVTFTNIMGLGADVASNYFIVQETSSPEAGVLQVTSAELGTQKDTVNLKTRPQNEVTYTIRIVNVRDAMGQNMAPPQLLVDPSVATFRGTPPTCTFTCTNTGSACTSDNDCDDDAPCAPGETDCENTCICSTQDTDGDGLPDHVEQRGWLVSVELTNRDGVFDRRDSEARDVTSDPTIADTDGDGLSDYIERELATDPRNPDTDGDGLSDEREFNLFISNPSDQDSDEDHLDDFLEVTLYKTSPILDDSDGDGLSDDREILDLNRNPRVADLPRWEFKVGDVRLQIDERYTFVDENGNTVTNVSNTSTTLAEESQDSTIRYNSKITTLGWELGGGIEISAKPSLTISGKGYGSGDTQSGSDTTSTKSAQQAYETSLSKGREFSTTRQVTREVFGASIDAPLTIQSTGDIAFSISNLELSVLQLGRDRVSYIPVATLVPNAELQTGVPTVLNLGPFVNERGPINLGTKEIFPSLVEDLLRAPRGPVIVPANFDITDEFGRNFAFASQEVNDRTATLVIDYGDGRVEEFNVSVAGSIDDKGFVGPAGNFVGGFDGDAKLIGIPLDYALQDILGFPKEPATPVFDSVTAGQNGIAETIAAGDDVQQFTTATQGLSDISVIISAGDNGVLDTALLNGDDKFAVTQGYATSFTCNELTTERIEEPTDEFADGITSSVAVGDDIQASSGTVFPGSLVISAGPNRIIDSVAAGDDVLRGPGELCGTDSDCPGGTCTGRKVLRRFGSSNTGDLNRAWLVYSDNKIPFGTSFGDILLKPRMTVLLGFEQDIDRDGLFARHEFNIGSSDRLKDTDSDTISDAAEVRDGWVVDVAGQTPYKAFPDPRTADSDGDGVSDSLEMTCGTDPRKRDTDDDGISDFDELNDDSGGLGAECTATAQAPPTHLDPLNGDTDGDLLLDGIEVALGSNNLDPTDSGNFLDTDEDGLPDSVERSGLQTQTGSNTGTITINLGDASPYPSTIAVSGLVGPIEGLTVTLHGLAHTWPSDIGVKLVGPTGTSVDLMRGAGGGEAISNVNLTFMDGASPIPSPIVSGTFAPTIPVLAPGENTALSAFNGTDGNGTWELYVFDTAADDFGQIAGGWSLNLATLTPGSGWDVTVTICNNTCAAAFNGTCDASCEAGTDCLDCGPMTDTTREFSDPTLGDTDFDGLPDLLERAIGSNPNNVDTDGDGLLDFDEFADFGQYFQNNFLFSGFFLTDAGSQQIGTSVTSQDTDGDRLSDSFERLTGWRILDLVAGNPPRDVRSSPLFADSDLDGLTDSQEYVGGDFRAPGVSGDTGDATDPNDPDTDGDGRTDAEERIAGTNPLVPDMSVKVRVTGVALTNQIDWNFNLTGEIAGGSQQTIANEQTFLSSDCVNDVFASGCPGIAFTFGGANFETNDLDAACGANSTFSMKENDVLVLRLRVIGSGGPGCPGVHCISDTSLTFDYQTINSSGFIQQLFDLGQSGVSGFSACGGKVNLEITRN